MRGWLSVWISPAPVSDSSSYLRMVVVYTIRNISSEKPGKMIIRLRHQRYKMMRKIADDTINFLSKMSHGMGAQLKRPKNKTKPGVPAGGYPMFFSQCTSDSLRQINFVKLYLPLLEVLEQQQKYQLCYSVYLYQASFFKVVKTRKLKKLQSSLMIVVTVINTHNHIVIIRTKLIKT